MRQIAIAIGDESDGDTALEQLTLALGQAGYVVRLSPFREDDAAGLVWQHSDDAAVRAGMILASVDEVIGPWMEPCEALARALRHGARGAGAVPVRIELGELAIDLVEREARRRGQSLALLKRELDLLIALARRPGAVLSRDALLRIVWRLSFDPGTNVVEVHMSRLRGKLDRGFDWPMLRTVRGVGYLLRPQP